jgi:hypothetical protein
MKYASMLTINSDSRNPCEQKFVTWPILCNTHIFRPGGCGDRIQLQSQLMHTIAIYSFSEYFIKIEF